MAKDAKNTYMQKRWEHDVAEHVRMTKIAASVPETSRFYTYAKNRIEEIEAKYPGKFN